MDLQTIKIGEIGTILTGLVVKRKEADISELAVRDYKMLTLKSFDQSGWLNTNDLEIFRSIEELDDKYLTQEGDVIVRLSYPYTSIVIDKEHVDLLIPSLFVIIRLEVNYLLPNYLSVYLNSDYMKRYYTKCAIGSTIQIMKTSMFKDVEVSFPVLDRQKKVVELNKVFQQEQILLARLIQEKTKFWKEAINYLMTGGPNNGD